MYRRLFKEVTNLTSPSLLSRHLSAVSAAGTPSKNAATEPQPKYEKSLNQVTLLGRVGANPQLRGTDQHPVTVFTVATTVNYKYQSGEMQQKTEWHRVSAFKPFLRDTIYKYLSKGQRVLVQGKLVYGQVTDAGGTIHTTATIVAEDVVFFNKAHTADEVVEEGESLRTFD